MCSKHTLWGALASDRVPGHWKHYDGQLCAEIHLPKGKKSTNKEWNAPWRLKIWKDKQKVNRMFRLKYGSNRNPSVVGPRETLRLLSSRSKKRNHILRDFCWYCFKIKVSERSPSLLPQSFGFYLSISSWIYLFIYLFLRHCLMQPWTYYETEYYLKRLILLPPLPYFWNYR